MAKFEKKKKYYIISPYTQGRIEFATWEDALKRRNELDLLVKPDRKTEIKEIV